MIEQYIFSFLAFGAVIFSTFGDTWHPEKKGASKISFTGWVIIAIALITFFSNVIFSYSKYKEKNWIHKSVYSELIIPLHDIATTVDLGVLDEELGVKGMELACDNFAKEYDHISRTVVNDIVLFNAALVAKRCSMYKGAFDTITDFEEMTLALEFFSAKAAIWYICESSSVFNELEACKKYWNDDNHPDNILNFDR